MKNLPGCLVESMVAFLRVRKMEKILFHSVLCFSSCPSLLSVRENRNRNLHARFHMHKSMNEHCHELT